MRPGTADSRSGLGFAGCGPCPHVMRLRPGPTVRTLKAELYCADALSGLVGANRARQSFDLANRRWVPLEGANSFA
jgi:hypothetical protein